MFFRSAPVRYRRRPRRLGACPERSRRGARPARCLAGPTAL